MVRTLCAFAILLVACGTPQRPPPPPKPTAQLADLDDSYTEEEARREASRKACPAITRPRLWRIEKAGKTSHVFGTYHIGVGRDRLPEVVQKLFANARTVVFESLNDDDTRSGLDDDAPAERSLSTELGPDAWARLVALVGAEPAEQLDKQPALVSILILSAMYLDVSAMLDEELEQAAKDLGKPLVALETSASLQGVFRRWFNARTLRAVLIASRGRREMRERSLASLADYCAGRDRDANDLGDGMSASERRQINHDLLDARNRAWMDPLERVLATGDAFVAVGAAHLRGKGSVIELLQRRGYRVTRVE